MAGLVLKIIKKERFSHICPVEYDRAWIDGKQNKIGILEDKDCCFGTENKSWSAEIEEIHEEPTKDGWIDVAERKRVLDAIKRIFPQINENNKIVVEFGSSTGYMIEEIKQSFPDNTYIATDLMREGLEQSYKRNPEICHIRCDSTNAPFIDNSIDFIFALNVLEHIENDVKAISECYRILKPGGCCLFVVPKGKNLYDYYDEMLFHKRRYSQGELTDKCLKVGFEIKEDFHLAVLCYPAFWLKKKINRRIGKKLTQKEKIERVRKDMNAAFRSPVAIALMEIETVFLKYIKPNFGIREFVICRKK